MLFRSSIVAALASQLVRQLSCQGEPLDVHRGSLFLFVLLSIEGHDDIIIIDHSCTDDWYDEALDEETRLAALIWGVLLSDVPWQRN